MDHGGRSTDRERGIRGHVHGDVIRDAVNKRRLGAHRTEHVRHAHSKVRHYLSTHRQKAQLGEGRAIIPWLGSREEARSDLFDESLQ
jgi:hypothetical protein